MLQFGMETKRINDIVTAGAKNVISDKEFLECELYEFITSPVRKCMIDGDLYYDYEHAIKHKKRMVIGKDGKMVEDKHLPNNKFTDNQYGNMVDQKVNYLLSKQLTFKTENTAYADALKQIFNKRFHRMLKNLGKDSYNGGIAWLYVYYDEQGVFRIKKFHPWEVLPFWKDDEHTELDFAVRVYDMEKYESTTKKIITYVEVYDTNGIHKFVLEGNTLVPDYSTYYFELLDLEGELIPYNWDRVPLIPFKANNTETPLLKKCKSLQDGINQILSSFSDGMEENASGNTILVIKNYDGTDLGQFRHNLSQYKAVKVRTVDGADGGIDSLQIEVNCDNYKVILEELRKALIQNCKGYDVQELKSSGTPNEMTIKAVYSQIDLDANEIETEYQASFEDLLWFVNQHLKNTGAGDFTNEDIEVIFNRDMMVNESQIITDINNSSAILSKKTCISQHPYVTDVEAELEQIKSEQEEAMEQFGNAFVNKTDPDDGNGDEPDGGEDDE